MRESLQPGAKPRALRVLVIEDEGMIAMLLEDILDLLGHSVARKAAAVPEALDAASGDGFDCAIVDLNLKGESALPVADVLLERGIAFGFASGYAQPDLDEKFAQIPVLGKPFTADDVERLLERIVPPA